MEAFFLLSRYEGIIPAIESSHAVAYAIKLAKEMGISRNDCHFGHMDLQQLQLAHEIISKW